MVSKTDFNMIVSVEKGRFRLYK